MPLDPNIILQGRSVQINDPLEVAQKAMSLKNLGMQNQALERQQEEAANMSSLLKKHTVQTPDGRAQVNRGAALSDLYKVNPQKAMELERTWKSQDLDTLKTNTGLAKELAFGATPQNWEMTLSKAREYNLPGADKLPQQFSPGFIENWKMATLSGEEQVKKMESDRTYALNDKKFKLDEKRLGLEEKKMKAETAKASGAKEGLKALDKDFAKDYNDWTNEGSSRATSEIKKIEGVIQRLKDKKGTTGGATGVFGDRFTSNDVLKNRADVQQSAMTLIKQLLSGATSDTDRKVIVDTIWNEADSTENNIERLERFAADMKNRKQNLDNKAKYYQKGGTLAGFKGVSESANPQGSGKNQAPIVSGSDIEWAD